MRTRVGTTPLLSLFLPLKKYHFVETTFCSINVARMDEPGLVLGIWFSKSRGLFYRGASSFAENGGTVIFIILYQIYALWIIKDTLFFFQDLLDDDGGSVISCV